MLQLGGSHLAHITSCVAALRLQCLLAPTRLLHSRHRPPATGGSNCTGETAQQFSLFGGSSSARQDATVANAVRRLSTSDLLQRHRQGNSSSSWSTRLFPGQVQTQQQQQQQFLQHSWHAQMIHAQLPPSQQALPGLLVPYLLPRRWQQHQQLALPASQHLQQQQQQQYYSTPASATKSSKGKLPSSGPSHRTLRALPFTVSRDSAAAAFSAYHARSWYQSKQRPALAKPFKETYLPFWVGSGTVRVEVRGAEVGHEHLVTRYDKAKGRAEPRWETVWSRVQLQLVWDRQLRPEEEDMQLYASWKYFRRDVSALRPGKQVQMAQAITPDMLQATPGSGLETRRVGPFTLEPQRARRLIMAQIESQERRTAEQEIARLTGAAHVRFVDLHCTWLGSTGAAGGAAAAAAGGLDLMPVYVPAYVFSWWHGGTKVRTFVSGVNLTVSGGQVLDDTKLATIAAASTTSLGLLLGVPASILFWGGLVVPFVAAGVAARFWPLLRTAALDLWDRWHHRHKFWQAEEHEDYCEADWNASYVHAYDRYEHVRQQRERSESYWQQHSPWGKGGADPFASFFEQMFKDPFSWFEQVYARQQQQQQQQSYHQRSSSAGGGRSSSSSGGGGSRSAYPHWDPKGYYKTLGVERGCTTSEVQAAFRGLALQHHPDRYTAPDDKVRATKRFQEITEAYQTLRDPKKKSLYDSGMA